jgi:CBS domain-containing protein
MATTDDPAAVGMPVRVTMTHEVLGIVPVAPLEVALRMMVQAGVRHLPVIESGHCLGLLYESDLLWRLWSTGGNTALTVGDVARSPAHCVDVRDDVRTAAQVMEDAATDAVLVVDGGRIVGIVTAVNLVHVLARG